MIESGKTVALEYTLKLADGSIVQSNKDAEPLRYVQGERQILPALEKQLQGMDVDQSKTVKLAAEDAYGNVNPKAFREVPMGQIPEGARRVGAELSSQAHRGTIRVAEVKDETIVLDFNHPLAGRDLTFDVRVLAIE
jgi:FKBP-type peptidyl-prolyl cis-trans isomerase 2